MWLITDVVSWPVATPRFNNRWAADSSLTTGDGEDEEPDDVLDVHVAADDQYGEPTVDGTGPQVLAGDVDCSTVPGGLDQIIVRTPPAKTQSKTKILNDMSNKHYTLIDVYLLRCLQPVKFFKKSDRKNISVERIVFL